METEVIWPIETSVNTQLYLHDGIMRDRLKYQILHQGQTKNRNKYGKEIDDTSPSDLDIYKHMLYTYINNDWWEWNHDWLGCLK